MTVPPVAADTVASPATPRPGWPAAPVTPALYDAVVSHTRREPITNRFRYRTYYWLIDLDNPPVLPRGLRWLTRFDADDHVEVRRLLDDNGVAAARIVMLAHPRVAGFVFNPISIFWCYHDDGAVAAVVAEVHNTYGGRHAYVLQPDDRDRAEAAKAMYVSPFYPVDGRYEIRVSDPCERLSVSVTLHRDGEQPFVASLLATRETVTTRALLRRSIRYPLAPLRTALLIRWQGIRLWRRGLPVQPR